MRDALETIEKIELYLAGKLGVAEAAAFEQEMTGDAVLQEAVSTQRALAGGLDRIARKAEVTVAAKTYHRRRNFIRRGIGGTIAVAILTTAVIFLLRKDHRGAQSSPAQMLAYAGNGLPELNEQGKREWATADSLIPPQLFTIDPAKDTVIETKGGAVMAISAGTFLRQDGSAAAGDVSLFIKEALDPATIISAGLSTMSGDRLLETGGMFFIDARDGVNILKIDPAKSISAEIPCEEPRAGMQLFTGKRMPDGSIDWVAPVAVPNDLLPVDITALDFYPPRYLEFLRKDGYETGNRKFTDSVYYSMAGLFAAGDSIVDVQYRELDPTHDSLARVRKTEFGPVIADTSRVFNPSRACGINPAKIKAIRSRQYQNTLLATREFEVRMSYLHALRDPALLDMYVNSLEKNLYEIDSMAARRTGGAVKAWFLGLAARRDGKVKGASPQTQKLRAYYALQTRLLTEAIAATQAKIKQQQAAQDRDVSKKRTDHNKDAAEKTAKNFVEELNLNVESAYRQLGYPRPPASVLRAGARIAVSVSNTGWNNLDRYVIESTAARSTLDYTDRETGKRAVIKYEAIAVSIAEAASYDRLLVYLIPDKLSSFMKMPGAGGTFTEKLNGEMQYDLVCIGLAGGKKYFLRMNGIAPKTYAGLRLQPANESILDSALNSLRIVGQATAMRKEIDFAVSGILYEKALASRLKWDAMISDLRHLFFPCSDGNDVREEEGPVNDTTQAGAFFRR